jgi:hypothetical protein
MYLQHRMRLTFSDAVHARTLMLCHAIIPEDRGQGVQHPAAALCMQTLASLLAHMCIILPSTPCSTHGHMIWLPWPCAGA